MRVLIFIILVVVALFGSSQAKTKLTGINLSAAGFASNRLPGVVGYDYAFPTESDMDYFFNRSMNVVRFPISWERIQPTKNGPLSSAYSSSLAKVVQYVTGKGKYLIVDVHNYQKYYGQVIEESDGNVTTSHLLDLYSKLYTLLSPYKEKVIWGIMNEPLGDSYIKWVNVCQLFINHMRSIGSVELLLIPGLSYTGAASWGKTGNYRYMWNLTDPLNNFAMEIHMYHDSYQSGTSDQCVSATIGSQYLNFVTEWMRNYKRKAFLGETGAGRNSLCYSAIDDTLSYLSDNSDVWLGWTWWAGGPRWGDYIYSLTPFSNNEDPPQWPYITPHINNKVPTVSEIKVNNYPRAGNVRVPIYNGDLNMMTSGSWASNITRQDPTKSYSSPFSYSFIPGGPSSGAIAWYGSGCMDTSFYTGMEFYINTEGNLANLNIQVIDIIDTKRERVGSSYTVAQLAQGTADSKGWTRVFLNFSSYDGSAHDGFMLWSSPVRPMVYIDQVSLIHRLDKDLLSPSTKTSTTTAKASTTTATSSKGSTTTTATSAKGSTTTTSSKGSTATTATSSKGSTTTAATATSSKGSTTTSATSSLQSTTTAKPNNNNNNNDGDSLVGLGSRCILSYGVMFIILVFIF